MDTSTNKRIEKKSSGFKKVLWFFFIVVIIGLAGYLFWKYNYTYSSGERYGMLQKFSYKGNVFKTYEGEMILSSVKGNANVPLASEKFYFSVTDHAVAKKIMALQGHYVSLYYKQKNGKLPWRGESEYVVDSVRVDQ